ncbi:MAG: hypothetical protein P9M14_12555 [Candidatus Alcyoniella australis]|nr:hypothetical protein [Candidatus Alcyoniella australis]
MNNPVRAAVACFVCGALLGLAAAFLVSPTDRPPGELLAMARELLQVGEAQDALSVARHVQHNPLGLQDPREADAVKARALAELQRCDEALELLDATVAQREQTPRLRADYLLVRQQCALQQGRMDLALELMQQIVDEQAGRPAAARARALFQAALERDGR